MDRYAVLSEEGAQNVADMASFVVKSMVKGEGIPLDHGQVLGDTVPRSIDVNGTRNCV